MFISCLNAFSSPKFAFIYKTLVTIYITIVLSIIIYYSGFLRKQPTIIQSHPCLNIFNISSDNDVISIQFKNNIQYNNPFKLSSYFGYYTSMFNLPLLMPPGSVYKSFIKNDTLKISFSIPFIDNYVGKLFCVDDQTYDLPPFQLPLYKREGILYEKSVNISINNFRSDFEGTQIFCHGDSTENRWCEALDIGMAHGKLIMQTKAHFEFPPFFLSLCGRSPPFDNESERIRYEPLLTKKSIAEISVGHVTNDEVAILASPCVDRKNVFSVIFDFLIPAYQTMQKSVILNDQKGKKKFRFFFRDSENRDNIELIQSITKELPNSPPKFDQLLIFEKAILGLEKADEDCDGTRSIFDQYSHVYKYNHENTKGFREEILNHFNIKEKNESEIIEDQKIEIDIDKINDEVVDYIFNFDDENENEIIDGFNEIKNQKKKALITFFDTLDQEELKLFNIEPLKRLVSKSCPFCEVRTTYIETPNISSLIEIASSSSVLIGRSGIGLENAVWLKNNSHVIELRPFGFWCNDRYEVAAKISGSHYHSVMNKKQLKPLLDGNLNEKIFNNCFSAPSYCESQDCYKIILYQKADIELNTFNDTWFKIQLELQKKFI